MQRQIRRRAARSLVLSAILVGVLSFGGQAFGQDAAPLGDALLQYALPSPVSTAGDTDAANREPEAASSVPTNMWGVQLSPGANADAVAARFGYTNAGQVGSLPDTYVFVVPNTGLDRAELLGETVATLSAQVAARTNGRAIELAAAALRTAPDIVWYAQQYAFDGDTREPSDPSYPNQWHLKHTGQVAGAAGNDANVVPVWNMGYDGTGVTISIVDEGFQHAHPDVSPNYLASASYDWNENNADPSPTFSNEGHGTSAGGVAAAADDGSSCGVGAAYNARLSAQRILAGPLTDTNIASALSNQPNVNHISNNSWGPNDNGAIFGGPGALAQTALANGVSSGRGGLGTVFVWANGNGFQQGDYAGADGYAMSRYTIPVAATDSAGVTSWYNEGGPTVIVNAPSDGNVNGITTTDLMGTNGYASGNCANDFGGTSSASPLTAGVIALMLDANPNLTWRDVKHILVNTADLTDTANLNWRMNGSGRPVSEYYGFGRVDAHEAVQRALTWTTVPAEQSYTGGVVNVNQGLVDGQPNTYVTSTHAVSTSIRFIENIEVVFNGTHQDRGDFRILLASPDGGISTLMLQRPADNGTNLSWTFGGSHFWGEDPNGTWTIYVSDGFIGDTGTFNNWQLRIYGTTTDPLNRITNGNFSQPIGNPEFNWGVFGSPGNVNDNIGYDTVGGDLEFYRKINGANSAAVLQYTRRPVVANDVVQITFNAQNTGVRRRLTVIAWNEDFSDLRVCSFWMPNNTALNTYTMRFMVRTNWTGAMLHFYASTATAAGDGRYRIDNVDMRLNRTTTSPATICSDPMIFGAGGGADSANILVNGDFEGPIGSANGNWGFFPETGIVWQQLSGILYYRRPPSLASAAVLQNTSTPVAVGNRFEATFKLANNTGGIQRVTVLIHSSNFADLMTCSFYVPTGLPLQNYIIRGFASAAWGAASASFYLSDTATGGHVIIDDVSLRLRPSITLAGTECYPAGSSPADVLPFEAGRDALPIEIAPTISAPVYIAPGMTGEQPQIAPFAPAPENTTGEGSVSE